MVMEMGERIRLAREARGLSQADLAKEIGVSQAAIQKVETGETRKSRFLPDIMAFLGIGADARTIKTEVAPAPPGSFAQGPADLPIYASARGGPGEVIITYEPIDYVARPDRLSRVQDAYAMYIVGDSMSPAFEQGDLVFVHPHKPFRSGDDVLVFREFGEGQASDVAAVVKRLVKATESEWHLDQFNPSGRLKLPRREWPRVHVIIGKYSRG